MRAFTVMVEQMHDQFLRAALDQARLGRGLCAPNPSVGAVAVKNGKIIAQAWHKSAGTPHAEALLLSQMPQGLSEVTLYVTLEPCNHWGKTPPCVDMIINHGIKRVIYGFSDPNPVVVANNTTFLLKKHDVEVIHHPLPEVDAFYESYRFWTLTKKPYVTAKIAQTFDGKIALANAQRIALSNSDCSAFTHQQRQYTDIILTTARTINQDDPLLNTRVPEGDIPKIIAIIDSEGALNPRAKALSAAQMVHIFHDKQCPIQKKKPGYFYHPIPAGEDGKLNLEIIINLLGELGYHDVWVEAGGELFSALHREKLVQKTYIYLVPTVLGPHATLAYHHNIFSRGFEIKWEMKTDNMIASVVWNDNEREEGCSQE